MNFEDLNFKSSGPRGVAARVNFPNGYGASVVCGPYTYGGKEGLYELAVLDTEGNIVYDTPITDDVLGFLSKADVAAALRSIEALPSRSRT